mmetsp:Transcript_21085/g.52120  ORF Transcript_21085/g.52120 Transcript_21085/m.52120 type:complete len:216 (-) Transcript_21085:515-1162(-)
MAERQNIYVAEHGSELCTLFEALQVRDVVQGVCEVAELANGSVQHQHAVLDELCGCLGIVQCGVVCALQLLLRRVQRLHHHVTWGPDEVKGVTHEVVQELQRPVHLLDERGSPDLSHLATRVVPNKAPGVVEASVRFVVDVAVDEQRDDPPVFAAESYGHIFDCVAAAERLEYLQHQVLFVRAKLHDRLPDVFLLGISKHVKLRLVGPQYYTISA